VIGPDDLLLEEAAQDHDDREAEEQDGEIMIDRPRSNLGPARQAMTCPVAGDRRQCDH
jgi:hypothetical protein